MVTNNLLIHRVQEPPIERWAVYLMVGIDESREQNLPASINREHTFSTQDEALAAGSTICVLAGAHGFGVEKVET